MITQIDELIAVLEKDPAERVICTHDSRQTVWHLLLQRGEVSAAVVAELLAAGDHGPRLVPENDGLLPGVSQTFRFSVTLQKRRPGRPRNPHAGPDAAARMALSRERQAEREAQRQLLIATMAERLAPGDLEKLEKHETFGPIISHARLVGKLYALSRK